MSKRYHIYAYKHFWPPHLDPNSPHYDPESMDIPMPYEKDRRMFVVEAESEKEGLKKAETEYGSAQRVENGRYAENDDGSWTVMGVEKVEL